MQMKLLARSLARRSNEVGVIYLHAHSDFEPQDDIEFIHIERGPKFMLLALSLRIARAIDSFEPDVVHTWLPEILTVPAALYCRFKRIPCLSAQRRILQKSAGFSELARDWLIPVSHLFAHKAVCNFPFKNEPFLARKILEYRDARVIRNGYARAQIESCPEPDWLRREAFKLLFVGRLVEQKQVDVLIEAVAMLSRSNVDVQLGIYGVGECEAKLREQVYALGGNGEGIVSFAGYRPDWASHAAHYDLFVLPSRAEGMPNVLVEAMGLGLATISSDIYEVSSFVVHGRDSWLVKPGSCVELADAIKKLRAEPSLVRRIAANGKNLADSFSIQSMVDAYSNLYQKTHSSVRGVTRNSTTSL